MTVKQREIVLLQKTNQRKIGRRWDGGENIMLLKMECIYEVQKICSLDTNKQSNV